MPTRAVTLLPVLLLASCRAEVVRPSTGVAVPRGPARPVPCAQLAPGPLQPALDAAPEGSALCLAPGTYPGPVRIARGVTVWGPREAVIRSSGEGTTVRLEGRGARLLGLTVDGSGGRFDLLDAAVHVQGEDAVVMGTAVRNATFGIMAERSARVLIRANHVIGDRNAALGLRGDAVRMWETRESRIDRNVVEFGRDVVVWYSSNNVIEGNAISGGRYGTHLMYSHGNTVRGNRYLSNVVGVFVMYSRDVLLERNLMAGSGGSAGIGLGLKESGNVRVADNRFIHNTTGAYLDTSPLQLDESNLFVRNEFRLGKTGIVFHSSQRRNTFRDNVFRDNAEQVRVDGGGDALGVEWVGNLFDDYEGYDLDADGFGDIPYELRSLSSDLISRYPDLEFLRGAPALQLVNAISAIMPLLEPELVLRDPRPRVVEATGEAG